MKYRFSSIFFLDLNGVPYRNDFIGVLLDFVGVNVISNKSEALLFFAR
jgi:hypothetical protein